MRRLKVAVFSRRMGAIVSLLAFLPSAVNAQSFIPVTVVTTVVGQADTSSTEQDGGAALPSASLDKPHTVPSLPEPFVLAQATPSATPSIPPALNSDARSLLDDAASYEQQNNPVAAARSLFEVMEEYPDSVEAIQGLIELTKYSDRAKTGVYTQEQLNAFELLLPTWEQCSAPESKYILMEYYLARAASAEQANIPQTAETYYDRALNAGYRFLDEYPSNPIVLPAILSLRSAAGSLGEVVQETVMADLADSLKTREPSLRRWVTMLALGGYYHAQDRNADQYLMHQAVLDESESSGVGKILDDPGTWTYLKACFLFYLGRAQMGMGRNDLALGYFQRIYDDYPNEGVTSELASLLRAINLSGVFLDDPYQGILAYQAVVDRYPESRFAPTALTGMLRLYTEYGNYDHAVELCKQIVQDYPQSPEAQGALDTIEYIYANLWDGQPIAKAPREAATQLAQACGPMALRHLLAMRGVRSTVTELATLAKMDQRGTSMLALLDAAHAKGVELEGVKASSLSDIEAPFIAYVNGNHFVVVQRVDDSHVTIQDANDGLSRVTYADFYGMWQGEALVTRGAAMAVARLDDSALESAVGGMLPDHDCDGDGWLDSPFSCYEPGAGDDPSDEPDCGGGSSGCPTACDAAGSGDTVAHGMDPAGAAGGVQGASSGTSIYKPEEPEDSDETDSPSRPKGRRRVCHENDVGERHVRMVCSRAIGVTFGTLGPRKYADASYGGAGDVDVINTGFRTEETDLAVRTVGNMHLKLMRSYYNPRGIHRSGYWTPGNFSNNIGNGWTHSLNIFLRIAENGDYGSVMYTDGGGASRKFIRTEYDSTWDYYEYGLFKIKRHKTNKNFIMDFPNGFQYTFSSHSNGVARVETIKDQSSNTLTFYYDNTAPDTGKLTKVTAPDGRYVSLDWSSTPQITKASIKDSSNNTLKYVEYFYSSGFLTEVRHDGESDGIDYEYGDNQANISKAVWISKIIDRKGFEYVIDFAYNSTRATKMTITEAGGLQSTFEFNPSTQTQTIKTWNNASPRVAIGKTVINSTVNYLVSSEYVYAQPADTTPAITRTYTYDSGTAMLTSYDLTGTSGHAQSFQYDSKLRITKAIEGSTAGTDPTTTYYYSATGNTPTKIVGPLGTEVERFYDSSNRLTKVLAPVHGATNGMRYFYNSTGDLTKVTDALDKDWLLYYDGMGNVTKAKNPLTQEMNLYYDNLNRVTKVADPMSKETFVEYSAGGGCSGCGLIGQVTKVRQAYGSGPVQYRDTQYKYDLNNNVTKVIDPQGDELDLAYDAQNRLTKVTYPSGAGGKSTTVTYDVRSLVTEVKDHLNKTTTFQYNWIGLATNVTDGIDSVALAYDISGNLTTVTDGNAHTWTYYYGAYNRLTKVTDPSSRHLVYEYNIGSQVTKVGAGSSGTVQPITYTYSTGASGTGLLTGVSYGAGGYANYTYDAMGKLATLDDDWKDFASFPPLEYLYDGAGRLTKLYDGTNDFLYDYNAAGAVTKVTDWADRVTAYAYNDLHELTGLDYLDGTAYEKSWSFAYTGAGQPDSVTAPNGMLTDYVYNGDGILTDILHKDGSTVKQGFSYLFDDVYNITKITHADSSNWTYAYDNRYRLTSAVRHNAADTIKAAYTYTYDDGDNLVTKVEPWADDFADGAANDDGWTLTPSGSWTVSGGRAVATPSGVHAEMKVTTSDADVEVAFAYTLNDTSSNNYGLVVQPRITSGSDQVQVLFRPLYTRIVEYVAGVGTTLHNNTAATSAQGVAYAARVEVDGNQVRVYRQPAGGGVETLVASATTSVTGAGSVRVTGLNGGNYTLDDVRVLADDLSRSTTFTAANNNELATMADYNGTTSYAFDDWGRLSTETRGSVTKTYGWTKANLLASVNSSDPADTDVSYGYTGDLKRLFRFENGNLKNSYNYGAGFAVTDEATWSGGNTVSKKTYADGLAEVDVTGTPAYHYLTHDHLGSTRGMWDGSKTATGNWEFTPYGAPYSFAGPTSVTQLYTGHDLERATGNYFAPFRTLNPAAGRWVSRDLLGMIDGTNMYAYVKGNPIGYWDPDGQWIVPAIIGVGVVYYFQDQIATGILGIFDVVYGGNDSTNAINNSRNANRNGHQINHVGAWNAGRQPAVQYGRGWSGVSGLIPQAPGVPPPRGDACPAGRPNSAIGRHGPGNPPFGPPIHYGPG